MWQQLHFEEKAMQQGRRLRMRQLILMGAMISTFPAFAEPACPDFYRYKALITEVYDADTVTADIDLGFNTWRQGEKLRLFGINAPEMKGEEKPNGTVARDALRNRILGKEVVICTIKDRKEKYGRYLAEIYVGDEKINDWLVVEGYARYQKY